MTTERMRAGNTRSTPDAAATESALGPLDAEGHALSLMYAAKALATRAHDGQADKVGEPYIGHPARVAAAVAKATGNPEAVAVAWLHDVVEDTDVTLDLLRPFFPRSVVEAVDAISKRKGEAFAAYYERVKANPLALVVKWHDVADNADPARLAKVAPDTRDRLRDKYERARALLSECDRTVPQGVSDEA